MGANQSGRCADRNGQDEDVSFDHFQILRAIGKGSFGKVCIVQKKDCKTLYAMKYMNKAQCEQRDALKNVCREVEILTELDHPFLVNLWFSFQDEEDLLMVSDLSHSDPNFKVLSLLQKDEEDLFMVSDLLLGGDLRYHIQQEVPFNEECVKLYVSELAMALDYLQAKNIVHRDIKPDNILLDEEGHAHLTDFNIAAVLEDGQLATSMSGTKPYMAPEIFDCAVDECVGYSFPVDWWSLGVVSYEMLSGTRPYDIHSATSISDVRGLFTERLHFPASWSPGFTELIAKLLSLRPGARLSSLIELRKMPCLQHLDFAAVTAKKSKPAFCPPSDHLNCDPTFELEEMIIESRPLHKKKKRLAKQRSLRETQAYSVDLDCDSPSDVGLRHLPEYYVYNRERELARRARESKESAWEEELLEAMRASDPMASHRPGEIISQSETREQGAATLVGKASESADDSPVDIAGQIRLLDDRIAEYCGESSLRSCGNGSTGGSGDGNRIAKPVTAFQTCLVSPKTPRSVKEDGKQVTSSFSRLCDRDGLDLGANFRVQHDQIASNLEFIDRTPSPEERAANISHSFMESK